MVDVLISGRFWYARNMRPVVSRRRISPRVRQRACFFPATRTAKRRTRCPPPGTPWRCHTTWRRTGRGAESERSHGTKEFYQSQFHHGAAFCVSIPPFVSVFHLFCFPQQNIPIQCSLIRFRKIWVASPRVSKERSDIHNRFYRCRFGFNFSRSWLMNSKGVYGIHIISSDSKNNFLHSFCGRGNVSTQASFLGKDMGKSHAKHSYTGAKAHFASHLRKSSISLGMITFEPPLSCTKAADCCQWMRPFWQWTVLLSCMHVWSWSQPQTRQSGCRWVISEPRLFVSIVWQSRWTISGDQERSLKKDSLILNVRTGTFSHMTSESIVTRITILQLTPGFFLKDWSEILFPFMWCVSWPKKADKKERT